jgi:hypothetical protein
MQARSMPRKCLDRQARVGSVRQVSVIKPLAFLVPELWGLASSADCRAGSAPDRLFAAKVPEAWGRSLGRRLSVSGNSRDLLNAVKDEGGDLHRSTHRADALG